MYSILLRILNLAILFAGLYKRKARLWISGRKNWQSTLAMQINPSEKYIWFHCASLGEFEDCREVFAKIQNHYTGHKFLLTVFSPSAYEVLKSSGLFDLIIYLPLDRKHNVKKFMEIVRPEIILIARSELWLNYILTAHEKKIPIFLISLKLYDRSNFLKWPLRLFFQKHMNAFTHIFCQNEHTHYLLQAKFNCTNTSITGNTRFESVFNQTRIQKEFADVVRFVSGSKIIIIGSSLPKEEKIFLHIYKNVKPLGVKWIIVPHEIEKSILTKKGWPNIIHYSNLNQLNYLHDVVLVDSVGLLKHLYKYADFAIIGGGFNRIGIHNIIEPAAFGLQTAFGPNYAAHNEACELLKLGLASVFRNSSELEILIKKTLTTQADPNLKEHIVNYVKSRMSDSFQISESIQKIILN